MLKRYLFIVLGFVCCLGFSNLAFAAATNLYSFDSPKQQHRFENLSQQFRCLVCQNESLADSNAPLAQDLRFQIYKMVKQNKSDQQVVEYLIDRYGDFVTFKPPVRKLTLLLWFGPFIMLMIALARLFWLIRQRPVKTTTTYRFSKQDREKIRHLLSEY